MRRLSPNPAYLKLTLRLGPLPANAALALMKWGLAAKAVDTVRASKEMASTHALPRRRSCRMTTSFLVVVSFSSCMGVTQYSGPQAVCSPGDRMAQELIPKLPAVTATEDRKTT
jgi:hypothetical protein